MPHSESPKLPILPPSFRQSRPTQWHTARKSSPLVKPLALYINLGWQWLGLVGPQTPAVGLYSHLQNRLPPFSLKKNCEHRPPHPFLADTVPPLSSNVFCSSWGTSVKGCYGICTRRRQYFFDLSHLVFLILPIQGPVWDFEGWRYCTIANQIRPVRYPAITLGYYGLMIRCDPCQAELSWDTWQSKFNAAQPLDNDKCEISCHQPNYFARAPIAVL